VLKYVENLWAVGVLHRTPLGSSQRSQTHSRWGARVATPFHKTPVPAVGHRPFDLALPNEKSWSRRCRPTALRPRYDHSTAYVTIGLLYRGLNTK